MVRLLLPALMLVAAVGSQVVFDESDRQDLAVLSQVRLLENTASSSRLALPAI